MFEGIVASHQRSAPARDGRRRDAVPRKTVAPWPYSAQFRSADNTGQSGDVAPHVRSSA